MQELSKPSQYRRPKFLKTTREIHVDTENKLDEQIKMNPHALTNFSIGPFMNSFSFNFFGGSAAPKPKKMKRLKKIASMFHQEKCLSNLIYVLDAESESEMTFAISKLKHLQYTTSLDLKAPTLQFLTPPMLKSLSIALSHLKNLKSLTFTYQMRVEMTPELLFSLFFALERMNNLTSFSLVSNYAGIWNDESWTALSSCLTRLPQLKSFALNLTYCQGLNESILSFLAPALKKLSSLQDINIGLFGCNRIHDKSITDFFISIKDLKSLKKIALNLGRANLFLTKNSDPISHGLSLLNPSQVEGLDFKYYSDPDDQDLRELGIALQKFTSLRELSLDFKENRKISDQGLSQLASSIKTLPSLGSLGLNLFSASALRNSVEVVGDLLKNLAKLTTLDLDFTGQKSTDDNQLSTLAAGLQGLTALKKFALKFSDFNQVTDQSFAAFSKALQGLTELENLKLELLHMRGLTNNGVISLSSALGSLSKLTYLSLRLVANNNFSKESTDSLGQAFRNLASLTSIHLDFSECQALRGEGDNFLAIFKALGQLKYLRKILASLPFSGCNVTATQIYTRQVTDQMTFWG